MIVSCDSPRDGTSRARSRDGFSLVEVILAIAICAFAVLPVMGLLPVALNSAGEALDMARRGKVIQQVSNDLQQSNFSALATNTSGWEWTFNVDGHETSDPVQTFYTVSGRPPNGVVLPGAAPDANPSLLCIVLDIATRSENHVVPLVIVNRGD